MFVVGERIEPTDEASEVYGATRKPEMTEGVVLGITPRGQIRIEITKGDECADYVGTDFTVSPRYFRSLKPLTADEAFEQLVHGQINDAQYIQALKKINKNT